MNIKLRKVISGEAAKAKDFGVWEAIYQYEKELKNQGYRIIEHEWAYDSTTGDFVLGVIVSSANSNLSIGGLS